MGEASIRPKFRQSGVHPQEELRQEEPWRAEEKMSWTADLGRKNESVLLNQRKACAKKALGSRGGRKGKGASEKKQPRLKSIQEKRQRIFHERGDDENLLRKQARDRGRRKLTHRCYRNAEAHIARSTIGHK